ncbi:MAG: hypothetical protein ACTHN3_11125 [Solirubrobacterales bacterium]
MLSWLASKLIAHNMRRLSEGDPRQTVCVHGITHLDAPSGERVYENRFVIWGHLAWGKMREYEVFEDTEKAKALDGYLESVGKLPAAVS